MLDKIWGFWIVAQKGLHKHIFRRRLYQFHWEWMIILMMLNMLLCLSKIVYKSYMQYINQNIKFYTYYILLKLIKIFILITLCFKLQYLLFLFTIKH